MKNLVIIGASGFAREMYDLANICYQNDPDFRVKGFLSLEETGIEKMGYPPILGTDAEYEIDENDVFFCAIGNVKHRKRAVDTISKKGGQFINLIHPTAVISPSVKLGVGVGIKAYCVLASDVSVGNHSFMQSSVIMGHDVKIGNFCHMNSFAFFAGHSKVGDFSTVNAGAKLAQNSVVEEHAVVGMGSVVVGRVKSNTTVFGNPARKLNF
jgi:sugar O-acyltransferase (sialic acid O-acetyltransferase NeuD family)